MTIPTQVCEVWTLTKNYRKRIQTAEIKSLRSVAGYKLRDGKRNDDGKRKELNVFSANEKIIKLMSFKLTVKNTSSKKEKARKSETRVNPS